MNEPPYRVRTTDAAAYCGLSRRTLEKLRLTGGGPGFLKIGRAVVYSTDDLDAWLSAHRRRTTSDNGEAPESRTP